MESKRQHVTPQESLSYVTGILRINQKNYKESYITDPDGGHDICISGLEARGRALDGDLVKIVINTHQEWKLNTNKIADKWDHYKEELWPAIEIVKDSIARIKANKRTSLNHVEAYQMVSDGVKSLRLESSNAEESSASAFRSRMERKKRSIQEAKDEVKAKSKIPSNLPAEISQLKYFHIHETSFAKDLAIKTGRIVEILKENHSRISGGYLSGRYNKNYALFKPTDHRVPRILVPLAQCPHDYETSSQRYNNVLFIARLLNWSGGNDYGLGDLVRIIGDGNNLQAQTEALLLEHQIFDHEFPSEVDAELQYLQNLPNNWFQENSKNRRDLTNECVLTIDPKTARDLDDALHIKKIAEQIYEVGVHIADVSYFVKEMTQVDYHARQRTTSVYLVDRVIPMLPRILCERMCSLNPGEPKLTFSVIWKMDKYGRIQDQWFGRTIIKSCAKLAYEQAQDIIENSKDINWIKEESNMPKLYSHDWKQVCKSVTMLNKISQNMRNKRFSDGALRIQQTKLKFELDKESGFPTGFSFEKRYEANYMIEEFMLLANMAVAKRIYDFNKNTAFLRRHPPSSTRLLNEVKDFCEAKGIVLEVGSSGGIQASLNSIKNPTMSKVVSLLLLRSMQPAEYICTGSMPRNDPYGFDHFALNVPLYTHFTSPIRRYPDIIVHRMLSLALEYERESKEDLHSLGMMAELCTKRKISSKTISDTSQKWYFNLFVLNAGYCELLACVTKIFDMSFDVTLIDYDRTGRVYLDRLKPNLDSYKYQSEHGIKRLELLWKSKESGKSDKSAKSIRKKQKKKVGLVITNTKEQLDSRNSLETIKSFPNTNLESQVVDAKDCKQVIKVFDIVRVIVTADKNDVTVLNIDLKVPQGQTQPINVKR